MTLWLLEPKVGEPLDPRHIRVERFRWRISLPLQVLGDAADIAPGTRRRWVMPCSSCPYSHGCLVPT